MKIRIRSLLLSGCCLFASLGVKAGQQSQLEWFYQTEGAIWSSVKVQQETAYFGSDDGHVYALNLTDKSLKWKFATQAKVRSHAAFYEPWVLFSSDDGFLYALDQQTGELGWKASLNDSAVKRILPANQAPWEFDYNKSSPVVDEGSVYIGSADGNLYSFSAKEGKLRWAFSTESAIRSTPAIYQEWVVFGSKDGGIYALNKNSGKLVWKHQTGAAVVSDPTVIQDKVIISSRDTNIYALESKTGKVVWQYSFPDQSWVESSAAADPSQKYFYIGSSDSHKLLKFEVGTGKPVWSFNTRGWSWGTPLVHNDTVYIGAKSTDNYWQIPYRGFYAVDAQVGELEWQYQPMRSQAYVSGGVYGQPALYKNQLLVPDLDGSLRVFVVREVQ
ncbi:PQQ-binding-like beta-propeller repeat protein [Vibrio metoecus]